MNKETLLLEIGCEELPAKSLNDLILALTENINTGLKKASLNFSNITSYHTPRRLAVIIESLDRQQTEQTIERKGPSITAPVNAIEGFLRANNISKEQLIEENGRFVFRYIETGKTIAELIPDIINKAISDLPIAKPMHWGNKETSFIRPVHWIVLLYGSEIISAEILGLPTSNVTYGHRFHHPEAISLEHANNYLSRLKNQGFVIADFNDRQCSILQQTKELAEKKQCNPILNMKLVHEVTNIVEWPQALLGSFSEEFLTVPHEALIAAMEGHQKCFPVKSNNDKLAPYFITISNISSQHPATVIHGNERVIHARLSDAKFFYETDCKQTLSSRLEYLKNVTFQAKLGTLYNKSQRIAALAKFIAEKLHTNSVLAERAGLLCKTDLLTSMVGEFPELQGIMGYYYAKHDGEDDNVANAIRDHYQLYPDKNNDRLNHSVSYAVALADRLDTLVGIFGINQAPSSDKDPFALRRAAIVILRILIEAKLDLNLIELIDAAQKNYADLIINPDTGKQVHEFILDRLAGLYREYNHTNFAELVISNDTLTAVLTVNNFIPSDIHQRAIALQTFRSLTEASALAEANKRANNLLTKTESTHLVTTPNIIEKVNTDLFQDESEYQLYQALQTNKSKAKNDYFSELMELASLQLPLANFFDNVMVIDKNETLKNNRLMLLAALRQACLTVADISLLQILKQ